LSFSFRAGGGGGNSHCCKPYHVGYGFSFALRYENVSSDSSEDFKDNVIPDNDPSLISFNSNRSYEDIRFRYDLIGGLLHEMSAVCGGYSSWCCLCSHLQSRIRSCIMMGNNGSLFASDMISPTSDCLSIVNQISKVSWLFGIQCCEDDRSNYKSASNFSLATSPCDSPLHYPLYSPPKSFGHTTLVDVDTGISVKLPLIYEATPEKKFELFSYSKYSFQQLLSEYLHQNDRVYSDAAINPDDFLYCYPNTLSESKLSPSFQYSSRSDSLMSQGSFRNHSIVGPVYLLFLCMFVFFLIVVSWISFVRRYTKLFSVQKDYVLDGEDRRLIEDSQNRNNCNYNSF
jgi:hypothetical protein